MKVIVKGVYPAKGRKVTVTWDDGKITTDEPLIMDDIERMVHFNEELGSLTEIYHAIDAYHDPRAFVLLMYDILDRSTFEQSGDEIPSPQLSDFGKLFVR